MEPRTPARVHTGLRVQPCPRDPSSGNQDPLRAQLCLHGSPSQAPPQKSSRVDAGHPLRSPAASTRTPSPARVHIGSPSRCLASYLQRKAETCLQSRRRAGSVSSGLAAAGVGHGGGCSPRSLGSRRGPASAAGHLGSAPGARTAPDAVLM